MLSINSYTIELEATTEGLNCFESTVIEAKNEDNKITILSIITLLQYLPS